MELRGRIFLLAAIVIIPRNGAAASCAFEGLLASCHKTLGGIPVQATAVINHCHEPIDITFILQSSHDYNLKQTRRIPPISWQYTYVTANDRPESRDIPGTGRRVMLHIAAKTVIKDPTAKVPKSAKVSVKAQFLLDGHVGAESLTFLDETVRIAHFEDCALRAEGSGRVESIAIAAILTIICLCFIGLFGLWTAQRNSSGNNGRGRGRDDEQDLVANMERTSKTSSKSPSQPPPPPEQQPPPPIPDDGFKVHYVVPVGPDESKRDCSNDFKEIYISTPSNGLQRVERNASYASSSSAATSRSSKSSSPCSRRDAIDTTRAVSTISETVPEELSAIAAAGCLGAVPKKKRSLASSPSSGSSASSSAASDSTAPSR